MSIHKYSNHRPHCHTLVLSDANIKKFVICSLSIEPKTSKPRTSKSKSVKATPSAGLPLGPKPPKPPPSIFALYASKEKPSLSAKHPELKATEIFQMMHKTFTSMSDGEKQPYTEQLKVSTHIHKTSGYKILNFPLRQTRASPYLRALLIIILN